MGGVAVTAIVPAGWVRAECHKHCVFATQPSGHIHLSPYRATTDGKPVQPEVTALSDGGLVESYYRNDLLHDPHDGRPAYVCYFPDGTVKSEWHYRDGLPHDPDDGRPAVVRYFPDGTVKSEWHYRDGLPHDPDDGRPAVVRYYPDGTVKSKEHWYEGVRQD